MISRYKLNIIFWYTGLVSMILIIVFGVLYSSLGYKLTKEIDADLYEKISWIEPRLRDMDDPYMDRRFYRYLISKKYDRRMDIKSSQ